MHTQYRDTMSSPRHGWRILLRLTAVTALAFALVAVSVSAAPAALTSSGSGAPEATMAATTCVAQIQKGSKLVPVYETYYKYAFKKVKGTKQYRKVVVKARRKMQVTCARQCVRTKVVKKKRVPVYKTVRKRVTVRKGNRLVKATKRVRVYVFEKCKIKVSPNASGSPVKIQLLDGSLAHLDFGAFTRDAPVLGTLTGFIPGGYKLNQDNQINLTRGNMQLGQTDVFIDDDCHGGQVSAAIRTGNPTNLALDPTRQSISTVLASGAVTATAYIKIQLPLELRNDVDGCDQPYITTGYTDFNQTFFLKGKIEKGTGLNKLQLTSAPDPLDVEACLSPGVPTSPCNNSALIIPLPIIVSTKLFVKVVIG